MWLKVMRLVIAMISLFLAVLLHRGSSAQQAANIPRIGFLSATSARAMSARLEAFRKGLDDLGYRDKKNILIDYRYADGNLDRLSQIVAEHIQSKPELIVSAGAQVTRAAKKATSTIPIVMAFDNDPVGSGFIVSLARPGGNITGLTTLNSELSGKRLELLKEMLPRLSKVAVFGFSGQPGNAQAANETELAARALGIKLQMLEIAAATDIEFAFGAAAKALVDAVLVLPSVVATADRARFAQSAIKHRLPTIYSVEFAESGGLITYGVNITDLFRRVATYVDKILKGAKPADLPVEQPTKFELAVNLKTAKQIGLTIPPNVLARADRVIK